jgi:hypothetical protein
MTTATNNTQPSKASKSNITTMTSTKAGEWKDRFTPRQLERKRIIDRVGQRRTREQLKKTVAELTARVELLTQGQDNIIIDRLISQNEELNAKYIDLKARLTSIQQLSHYPPGGEGQSNGESPPPEPSVQSISGPAVRKRATTTAKNATALALSQRKVDVTKLPFFNSVSLHQSPRAETGTPGRDTDAIPSEELVDIIMSWKINALHGLSFDFLIACTGVDRIPDGPTTGLSPVLICAWRYCLADLITAQILKWVRRSDFSQQLYQSLSQSGEYVCPFATSECDIEDPISEIETQRRAVLFCAFLVASLWRDIFTSTKVCHAQFWALYRYFMVSIRMNAILVGR